MGTDGDVFTYVGPLRYPGTSCGFFFRPEIERRFSDTAIATPFDSGATLKHLRPSDSLEEQIAFVRRHELPVPEYREYLERCLALLFGSPLDYVDDRGPDRSGPIPTQGGDARRWTFEVRFERELSLTGTLLAVILPIALAASLTAELAVWGVAGVDVRYYRTPGPDEAMSWRLLYEASVGYLRDRLRA